MRMHPTRSTTTFMTFSTALCLLFAIPSPAIAGKLAGVTMPDKIKLHKRTFRLNGLGLREAIFGIDVYVVGMYVNKRSKKASDHLSLSTPIYLHMHLVRGVSKSQMSNAFTKALRRILGSKIKQYKGRINTLGGYMEPLKKGEKVSLYLTGKGLDLTIKGKKKKRIPGKAFAQAILEIFIGKRPVTANVKRGLLGK